MSALGLSFDERNKEAARARAGAIGALLRREGLYSSQLAMWREEHKRSEPEALAPKKRGRKPKEVNPLSQRVHDLEKTNRQLGKIRDRSNFFRKERIQWKILVYNLAERVADLRK